MNIKVDSNVINNLEQLEKLCKQEHNIVGKQRGAGGSTIMICSCGYTNSFNNPPACQALELIKRYIVNNELGYPESKALTLSEISTLNRWANN